MATSDPTPRASDAGSAWSRFWHQPGSAINLGAARALLAAAALWVVLSRHDLPSILAFPPELWVAVTPERRLRFLMVAGLAAERFLYALLHLTLLGALLGVRARTCCFVSGLLLYHFAPFETIIRSPNPYLRGLTIPALGLLIASFAASGDALALVKGAGPGSERSRMAWEYGWPLRLIQVLFCQIYVFAAWSKIVASGLAWPAAGNIRGHLLVLNQALVEPPEASWGYALAAHPALCAAVGWAGLLLELSFPLVLVSTAARWVLLPTALIFHLGNALLFRIVFQNLPLLLLFVDWDALARWRRRGA